MTDAASYAHTRAKARASEHRPKVPVCYWPNGTVRYSAQDVLDMANEWAERLDREVSDIQETGGDSQ